MFLPVPISFHSKEQESGRSFAEIGHYLFPFQFLLSSRV